MAIASSRIAITPQQAHEERVKRQQAREDYVAFRHYMEPKYRDGKHNLVLAAKLEQVYAYLASGGKEGIGRLIVEMPAQYGKTTDISRLFPAYCIGRLPDLHIALTAYGANLSDASSAAVRNYVTSERFSNLFGPKTAALIDAPIEVSDTSASRSDWDLGAPHHGGCVSRGIGGGLSGKPADLLIIDDPTKDIEEARSESHQAKLKDWYESVAFQRLSEGGAIIIIHTRWDPNDLIGQLLKKMGSGDPRAEQWNVLYLPALALEDDQYPKTQSEFVENLIRGIYIPMGGDALGRQPGEALWPWKYSRDYIERKKANSSAYVFAAMDQQLPRSFSGGVFDDADIGIIEPSEVPDGLTWVAYVDVALGRNKSSDYNAALIETLDPQSGNFVARNLIREQELNLFLRKLRLEMLRAENAKVIWGLEDVSFQSLAWQNFWRDPELALVSMVNFAVPEGSKMDRALNLSLRAKEGHYKLVRGTWNLPVIRQMTAFPHDKHDDMVDSASGGLYMIAKYGKKRESKIW
jgi:phage terminase large subunit-like protein